MAKVYESEIDPDEFIRSFREEPSGLSSMKKPVDAKPEPYPEQAASNNTEEDAPKKSSSGRNHKADTDREREYMERFVWNMTYMSPQDKFVTTEIDPEIEWKIRRILFCRKKGRVCSLKAFINNVLAAHFEEYADVINSKL